MTREEMAKEAEALITDVEKYAPDSGKVLREIYNKVVVLSCSDATTKDQTFQDSSDEVDGEVKKAEKNIRDVLRLKDLLDQAVTVKCGG